MSMMRVSLWVGLVVLASRSDGRADERSAPPGGAKVAAEAAPDPGALDAVVAQSARDGKPLIVEFYTTWCAPCKQFEAQVLPQPKVQAALAGVRFVRYDAEHGSGIEAAEKFRVNTYPTFLAVDDKGAVQLKRAGSSDDPTWFLEFLQRGSTVVQSEDRVLAARKRAPGDARIAEATGRWYVAHDRAADALPHLEAAVAADKANAQGVAAEAAWDAAGIRRAAELRARVTRDLLDYVRAYPGASHAIDALTVASVDGNLSVAERNALWQRVVEANKASASVLNEIVYDALAAGALDAALDAGKRQVALARRTANSLDSLAEVHHARREKAEALAREDEALALLAADAPDRKPLAANRARFAADTVVADDGTIAIRGSVAQRWKRLGSLERGEPERDQMSEIVASMNAYQTAKKNVLAEVGKACAAQAGTLTEAYARIDLAPAPPKVTILEPDASPALKKCLVERLAKASYPKRPAMVPAKAVDRVPLKDTPPMMPH